jgi:hypothetical protein
MIEHGAPVMNNNVPVTDCNGIATHTGEIFNCRVPLGHAGCCP